MWIDREAFQRSTWACRLGIKRWCRGSKKLLWRWIFSNNSIKLFLFLPPPFSYAVTGKRQILPSPTLSEMQLIKNSKPFPKVARFGPSSMSWLSWRIYQQFFWLFFKSLHVYLVWSTIRAFLPIDSVVDTILSFYVLQNKLIRHQFNFLW